MRNTSENIVVSWFSWHFYLMPKFLFEIWENYIFFVSNYFSVPLLIATLFSPWRRYKWRYPKGFDIGGYFSTFVSNVFSRILGALSRSLLIVFGVVAQLFVVVVGLLIIFLWVLLPLVVILLMMFLFYGL